MTVTAVCHIAGRGLAIITDEAFSAVAAERARGRTRIRILGGGEPLELEILDVESVLMRGGKEVMGFLVKRASDERANDWVGGEIQLL